MDARSQTEDAANSRKAPTVSTTADDQGNVYCTCCPRPKWLGQLTGEHGRFYCHHGKRHHIVEQPTKALLVQQQITALQQAIQALTALTPTIEALPT